jgi:outer membrane protein insertion porin family
MYRIVKDLLLTGLLTCGLGVYAGAQTKDTLPPISVNPKLIDLQNQTIPQEYIIRNITVSGYKTLDPSIIISISGLSVGDKVTIPGSDNFSRAIQALWKQNLLANAAIYYTAVEDKNIDVDIEVSERPRLSKIVFKGIKKGDEEDLTAKAGLVPSRVVTENVKKTAKDNIRKYYVDKSFLNTTVRIEETPDPTAQNLVVLTIYINKGKKVKINEINFYGNDAVTDLKLKKQMKGTKEMSKFTLSPVTAKSTFGENKFESFKEFVHNKEYLHPSKIKDFLDPYFRFKLFSSARFDRKKYEEDKEKIIAYYNALGYRDAIIEETEDSVHDKNGNLNINIKVREGHKYYFGNISWKGNSKYSDSLLNTALGIRKGDIYNAETLNKKLGKQLSAEGGDISGLYLDDGYLFFQVDPVETSVYNDTIDFEIRMREGPQATIKNVTIAGNDKTKEHVIRRELRTIPGEKFSRSDIIRSQRELSQLGYFNQEKIGITPIPNYEEGTVDIAYSLEEKSADQLELSAGWGGGIGLTGTLGVTFNNFSTRNIFKKSAWDPLPQGDGQKLSLRVQSNGRFFQSYNLNGETLLR